MGVRFYQATGGTRDGQTLSARKMPPVPDSGYVWVHTQDMSAREQYRRVGGSLVFVKAEAVKE